MRPSAERDGGLFRHGLLLVAGTLLGAVCNAGFHMVVGRTLPPAEYGALVAMLGVVLAATTPMLAVQNTLSHFTSALVLEGRRGEVSGLFMHWAWRFAGISALFVAGGIFFRAPLSTFWGGLDTRLVAATFWVLAASLWMNLFFGLLQGVQSFAWLAFAPQAWGVLRLVLGWALTVWFSATALAAILAQGVGVLAVLALCTWAVAGLHLPWHAKAAPRPPGTYRYLLAAFTCLAGYAMLMNLDTAIVRRYFDAETTGLFAKAATIARTAVFLPVPIATALFPKVTSGGDMTPASWRLLLRALWFAGGLIAGAAGVCIVWPQLPWSILYGTAATSEAAPAAALVRAMVPAMVPLAFAYLLLNFEMAQRRFRWCLGLLPCGLLYVAAAAVFHRSPLQVALCLAVANSAALLLLVVGIRRRRLRSPSGPQEGQE